MAQDITRELARFVLKPEHAFPEDTTVAARRSLINFLGVSVGGGDHPAVDATVAGLQALGAAGDAPLFGRRETLDASGAAMVNGIASAVLDFDSTQLKRTNIHPSGPTLPALFALASRRRIEGAAFMEAYILAVEVACRIGNTVLGGSNAGWHVTGVAGGVGAAAGAARLLGLGVDQTVAAMGIAANQASGLREMYGTMCKALIPGRAAQAGLHAALMAEHGFTGPDAPLEGKKGLARVFGGLEDASGIVADLSQTWEIDLNTYKPYPCAVVTHATIDAGIALRREGLTPDAIASIVIDVAPIAIELAGVAEPRTELECKFSLAHCVAVALSTGAASTADFAESAIHDEALHSLRRRVTLTPVASYRKEEATVRVIRHDGSQVEKYVPSALGSLRNPMSDGDVAAKFRALVDPCLGPGRASEILDQCHAMERADIAALARSCSLALA